MLFRSDTSRSPLFDVMIVLQNNESTNLHLSGLETNPYRLETGISKFDLTFSFAETEDGIKLHIEYNTDLFKQERIERLCTHFEELTKSVVGNPADKIGALNLLSESEKHRLLVGFNDTKTDYPKDKTIVDLFVEQAAKTPDNIAVVFEDIQLTYRELDQKSNQTANFLIKNYSI